MKQSKSVEYSPMLVFNGEKPALPVRLHLVFQISRGKWFIAGIKKVILDFHGLVIMVATWIILVSSKCLISQHFCCLIYLSNQPTIVHSFCNFIISALAWIHSMIILSKRNC
ncbi:hypothetical protein RJT34_24637 [Clitoria ternatea]|uniref:Uncharacterized protein n=1 Tax=Clitoria ternatea TaxID=43366 RepID=A0AAN9FNE9_CLITE